MPKTSSNPHGRVNVDLLDDKKALEQFAELAGTTPTNLARLLIRDGLEKLKSGKFRISTPSLVSKEAAQ